MLIKREDMQLFDGKHVTLSTLEHEKELTKITWMYKKKREIRLYITYDENKVSFSFVIPTKNKQVLKKMNAIESDLKEKMRGCSKNRLNHLLNNLTFTTYKKIYAETWFF